MIRASNRRCDVRWGFPMRLISVMTLLGLLVGAAQAEPLIRTVEIVDYGVYVTGGGTKVPAEKTANGWVRPTDIFERKDRTDQICAKLGLSFGIEYVVEGVPNGEVVVVEMVTRFPPAGVVNDKGQRFGENRFPWQIVIGKQSHRTFTFDEAWELVPGRWSLEFFKNGRKIGGKDFDVTIGCPVS